AAKMEFCIVLFVSLSPSATAFASSRALETFKLIDEIYTAFDSIVDGFGFFKYHHINDTYVICCPRTSHPFHVPEHLEQYKERCVREAVLIAKALIAEASKCKSLEGEALWAKVGIACGPLAGAIVGKTRRFYCLFGDAVNTSARMCSHSQPGSILCTSEFHSMLTVSRSSDVNVVEREEIHVKGKGMMKTFLL
ncbi:hypothetical protein GUITHDRAFT_51985, partial [Guillardia theta CCMP2712]